MIEGLIMAAPNNLTIFFILGLVGVFALLLARAAGIPGLLVGLLMGAAMAFMAELIPLWLLVLISLAMLTLTGFALWGRGGS